MSSLNNTQPDLPPAPEPAPAPARQRIHARGNFLLSREKYAEIYGTSSRSIGNWIRHGCLAGEVPPLDDPVAMVAWWGKLMEHRVPDKIYAAASKVEAAPALDVGMVTASDNNLSTEDLPPQPEVLSTGFLASLIRTRDEEAKAHRRYQLAVAEEPPDEGKIRVQQKTWQDLADHLRSLEKAAPDVLRKSGDMWLSVDVVKELADIHGAIVNGVRSLGRRWAMKAAAEWTISHDRVFQDECDRLFSRLIESKFTAHE